MPASSVAAIPAAPSDVAAAHFAARLSFETDCADVHEALSGGPVDFVLLDVRGPKAYAKSHVPGALNIPHREMTADRMAAWPAGHPVRGLLRRPALQRRRPRRR